MENTEVYNDETDGVLRLKLEENAYEWRFVPVEGKSFTDSGSTGCHRASSHHCACGCGLPPRPSGRSVQVWV
jgi:hypothetical protein